MNTFRFSRLTQVMLLACSGLAAPYLADADANLPLPTGQYVTPTYPTGANLQYLNPRLPQYPNYVAGIASRSAVSPDGNTLLVATNGYNRQVNAAGTGSVAFTDPGGTQYVFVYDISGANKSVPALKQVLLVPQIYEGLVWASNTRFYVSGGYSDSVLRFDRDNALAQFGASPSVTIPLGHTTLGAAGGTGIGFGVSANAAGIALTQDGNYLLVANMFNDSISVISLATNTRIAEYDLRPYNTSGQNGVPGGEQPYDVQIAGNKAFVTSLRDREVVVLDITNITNTTNPTLSFVTRIKLKGAPTHAALSPSRDRLYVAEDVQDYVAVIDTATNGLLQEIDARAPAGVIPSNNPRYTGTMPTSVTVSPDGNTLFVTNGGNNAVAIIPLSGPPPHAVAALVPTAWYPQSVSLSQDGTQMYIVSGKSDQGVNPANLTGNTPNLTLTQYPGGNTAYYRANNAQNQYELRLHRAALVSAPVPAITDYADLTAKVAANNFYSAAPVASDQAMMAFLRGKIQHVIYIVKENRTFDQVLGDLGNGANADPTLAVFGRRITPNFHNIARNFVTLDNFFDPGDASMNGWAWTTMANATDQVEKAQQLNYAGRGLSYDTEGDMRNVDVGLDLDTRKTVQPNYATQAAALPGGEENLLRGPANVARTDAADEFQGGLLWEAALRGGKTVRNYGFFVNNIGARVRNPYPSTPQVYALDENLTDRTDVYFRGYDQAYPDVWRMEEWKREFDQYVANNNLPNLQLVRLGADHMGSFSSNVGGFNTPEKQQADNDLAVGRLVAAVAKSPYANSTLIFVVEDDPQDGPDHMDSHRSTAYVVGPYVKHNAVVSTRYTTVNMIRTMEDVLGVGYLNLNDSQQRPMTDMFDKNQASWTFSPIASTVLAGTQASIAQPNAEVQFAEGPVVVPTHDAAYWDKVTEGFDFSDADRIPYDRYNKVLWEGLMGDKPYPTLRSGKQLGRDAATSTPAWDLL